MLEAIRGFGQGGATLLLGIALGAAWIMTIVSPNVSYDRLDYSRADGHVRLLLNTASAQIAFILVAASALAVLGGAIGAGIASLLAAFGFFSNRWVLASFKKGETAPGTRGSKKGQRVMAVTMTLMFSCIIVLAAILALLGL